MGRRRFLPLTPAEVCAILTQLGFRFKIQEGSHAQWERPADGTRRRAVVTVDMKEKDFGSTLMQSMVRQSNFSHDEFYGGTKKTARKASVSHFRVTNTVTDVEMD